MGYEGQHNDARTATCIALAAAEEGATITNHTEMVGIVREGDLNDESTTLKKGEGKAVGAIVRDKISGKEFVVRARSIIFAGGPFTDGMRKMEDPKSKPAVNGAAGTHIILPGYYSPDGFGLLDVNTSDGRFLFFLPWEGNTLVGTTDRKGTPTSSPGPPEDDVQYLLKECEKYISPDLKIRRSDVLSSWQGWRPLASDPNAPPGAPASRDHVISVNPDTGITFIVGGRIGWKTAKNSTVTRMEKTSSLDRVLLLPGVFMVVRGTLDTFPSNSCSIMASPWTRQNTLRGRMVRMRLMSAKMQNQLGKLNRGLAYQSSMAFRTWSARSTGWLIGKWR